MVTVCQQNESIQTKPQPRATNRRLLAALLAVGMSAALPQQLGSA
ncbi:MAG: hypothetical protein NTZ50_08680 [Chloroflexi bacterium]|nr:hypothetical protein [Chloroflexota bacterium]